MSVVDGSLRVYGIENLRIADGSIMPRVTTGNTMAACVIIGERAGELLRSRTQDVRSRGVFESNAIRTADGSIMPWVTAGNTMTPCVVIGGANRRDVEKGRYNYE